MLLVEYTNKFKKDLKPMQRRGKNIKLLRSIMKRIEQEKKLNSTLKDHPLSGIWENHRELHVQNDWLLIYRYKLAENKVIFSRTGTHSDLF